MLPTPEALTLDQIAQRFNTDERALAYLEEIIWPHGPVCPHCQNADPARIWKLKANAAKEIRLGLYECGACGKQFRVTVGTIFEDSKIPLR
ncbi:MAG: transposase, partial [Verrucomicrobia bacterium]|nr:transposase [Verrucomicrobiota bacterium]